MFTSFTDPERDRSLFTDLDKKFTPNVQKYRQRIHNLFEECCDTFAQKTAIIFNEKEISYSELDRLANQLARYLLKIGLGPDDRIGILLPRSVNIYTSLLAVVKIWAAYVPMDPCFPNERVKFIAQDANLKAVITTSDLAKKIADLPVKKIILDEEKIQIRRQKTSRIEIEELPREAKDNLCYIIYTSGTTGQPKGVAIEHPAICNFVKVAATIYDIRESDRIYQGMTIAFDFSVEEIWLGLTRGATIIPGPSDRRLLGEELADFLIEHKVTVLCCVPTLLATIEKDIPSLRTLIVGGEPCPKNLVWRWYKKGRRLLNTYGPTETTVTATWCELRPGKPVTIGKPLPTYTIYILDEKGHKVAEGEVGEICIAGVGLARGYINQEEKTKKAFFKDPFNTPNNPSGRIYRTGDLGRINKDGEIEYLGRIDSQVKIRGYRIELSEIESVILESPQVKNVVVAAKEIEEVGQELVAYIEVKEEIEEFDPREILERLRKRLPAYMIPAYIEPINKIPTLPSGKADRQRLPAPQSRRLGFYSTKDFNPPKTETENLIANELAKIIGLDKISVTANFFIDLGAHSLLIARLASILRRQPGMEDLALKDFYRHPTIRELARFIDRKREAFLESASKEIPDGPFLKIPSLRIWSCGALQLMGIVLIFAIYAIPGLYVANWIVHHFRLEHPDYLALWGVSVIGALLTLGLMLIAPIIAKWSLLGHLKPGSYPLWSGFFLRFWIVDKMLQMAPLMIFSGTSWLNFYYRLLGARIGKGVIIASPLLHCPDLIEIGEGTSINTGTHLFARDVKRNLLILDHLRIDKNCIIGSNSVLMPGAIVEPGATVGDQTLIGPKERVSAGTVVIGSPGKSCSCESKRRSNVDITGDRWTWKCLFFFSSLFIWLLPLVAFSPSMIGAIFLYKRLGLTGVFAIAPFAGLSFVITLSFLIILLKKIILPQVKYGPYPLFSGMYFRKWFVDRLMEISLMFENSLYATLYVIPFLRCLGTKVGRLAEISTISFITPDLLEIGAGSFLADVAHVGPMKIEGDRFYIYPVKIEERSFIGNAAFVPGGTTVGKNALIGVLSTPPIGANVPPDTTWLGSPPILFPSREQFNSFSEELTYSPSKKLIAKRLTYEFFRVILPPAFSYLGGTLLSLMGYYFLEKTSFLGACLLVGIMTFPVAFMLTLLVAGIKWFLVGTYIPRVRPMWSSFVWRTELVTAAYENVVVPWLLTRLTGTPFIATVLRLFGAKIGRQCFLETTFLTEFDLVTVEDDTCVGLNCSLQTHLFEDRIMKMSRLHIGKRCYIGPRAVVLYDTKIEDDVELGALSLVMKGETLTNGTCWQGSPAIRKK